MEQLSAIVELQDIITENETKSLWVFGYGSLCWNPGFPFEKAVAGHIQGYSRKFWQGNNTHRGTKQQPGRVVTLVKENDERTPKMLCVGLYGVELNAVNFFDRCLCRPRQNSGIPRLLDSSNLFCLSAVHGIAFQVTGEAALSYLNKRECTLGGYITEFTTFFPTSGNSAFTTILYIATAQNDLWLGDAPLCDIANQITDSKGDSGYNVEYLLRLARFMRHHFPYESDDHLYTLEKLVTMKITDRKMCLKTLMGDETKIITFIKNQSVVERPVEEIEERIDSFQYTTRVPEKTLRCLNI